MAIPGTMVTIIGVGMIPGIILAIIIPVIMEIITIITIADIMETEAQADMEGYPIVPV